jgi:hypothetical protein
MIIIRPSFYIIQFPGPQENLYNSRLLSEEPNLGFHFRVKRPETITQPKRNR